MVQQPNSFFSYIGIILGNIINCSTTAVTIQLNSKALSTLEGGAAGLGTRFL